MDEFTQLIEKPDKGQDIGKTVQNFTKELVTVQQNINTLKQKNIQKATEVAKIVQAQTPIYEDVLIKSAEKLGYVLPEEREQIAADINHALEEVNKTNEITDELAGEGAVPATSEEDSMPEEIIIPVPEERVESESIHFEDIQPETNKAENKVE